MARKKKPLPLLENITITDIAAEGKAIAKVDGLAVFVPFVIPGDVVDLQIRRKKHSFAEAEAVNFHQYSPGPRKTILPALWSMRRLQMADSAIRTATTPQAETG